MKVILVILLVVLVCGCTNTFPPTVHLKVASTTSSSESTSTTLYHLEVQINVISTTTTLFVCVCPTSTTLQSTTSTILVCPTCPTPINYLDEQTKHALLNLRWDKPTGSAAQWGYKIGKEDCLAVLNLKNNTFNGQPVYGVNKPIEYANWANNSICFPDVSVNQTRDAFQLDTSVWWTNNTGSNVTFRRHKYPSLNFTAFHNGDEWCWDFDLNESYLCG